MTGRPRWSTMEFVPRPRTLLPWLSWVVALVLGAAAMLLSWDELFPATGDIWVNFALVCGYPLAGAVILTHRPGHAVGRLLCAVGLGSGAALAVHQYATRAVVIEPGRLPLAH